ncbi:hypothetical protein [Apilactobacillus micheneri]|uniref:Uncharacterized protein n=1 Tax=Apilactobacillus micheneri TaxID=1899430 RepID=A0A9Q8INM2_9LACO|nr:hypothetical protein [Apilactobacillus micheneri]TPR39977.1 hypothetical protein DY121_03850 [Apilactobacillus micheneri]TPR44179.1 hypothetical protein DY130_03845 [Apilactobacillus micheneri]TPR45803.1 hypothetical protein DY128_03845 [Apilactobacillus micheneri]TPR50547.1 hypothetical protein DY037_00960 [Apilactobacillus micheneri]TPR51565.1 hypothetical protein DY126_03905 [Apilactobacillus micheneri]
MFKFLLYNKKIIMYIFITFLILFFFIKLSPKDINNFTNLMSGILTLSSIAVAFSFSCFSLIPTVADTKIWEQLKKRNTDVKIAKRLLSTILIFLVTVILSILILVLFIKDSNSLISVVFISLLFSFLFSGILELFSIVRVIILAVETRD